MPRLHIRLALIALSAAALLAAPSPGAAQSRYDAGSFTVELPPGIQLALTSVNERPTARSETFAGVIPGEALVMVIHTSITGLPADSAMRSVRGYQQIRGDSARLHAAVNSARDTSQAAWRQTRRMLNDTSLSTRRAYLRQNGAVVAMGSRYISVGSDTREIVTPNRLTLRSPATVQIDTDLVLVGTVDVSVPRRGPADIWLVVYAAKQRTAESNTAATRMLDSFSITGAPTSVPVTPLTP